MKHEHPTAAAEDDGPDADYQPVTLRRRRHDGWTADRQRCFLTTLAETGCISEACIKAGITARSAYRLRAHPDGARFAQAWDRALRFATARLLTLAYERAIRGGIRELWRDGKLVAETRQPSDRLLTFLLGGLAPWNGEPTTRWARLGAMAGQAATDLAPMLDALGDSEVPAEMLAAIDLEPRPALPADPPRAPFDEDDW